MGEDFNPPLRSGTWYAVPPADRATGPSPYLGMVIGVGCGLTLVFFQHRLAGGVVCLIALTIGICTLRSERCAQWFQLWFHRFGQFVGRVVALLCLTPLLLVGFSIARCLAWLTGSDPLQLRHPDQRTFWIPSDRDQRKRRFTRSMFATESPAAARGGTLLPWLVCGIVLLVTGELLLRLLGFGHAVLYTAHPTAGYFPAPNQHVDRLGGVVETNGWGMRAPDFRPEPAADVFRILMLGDSTLYGGQYISNAQLYARLLADQLSDQAPFPTQVLNMGVNGWGPFNELGYVRAVGTFDADLCIICLPVDDFRRAFVPIWETPYFRAEAPPRLAYEEVLYHLNWRQRMKSIRAEQRQHAQLREQAIEQGMQCYLELAGYLRAAGCEVMFEILPSRAAGTAAEATVPSGEAELVAKFRELLSETEYDLGFPTGLFRDGEPNEDLYHDGIHLGVNGHAEYAVYLTDRVTSSAGWRARGKAARAGQQP